MLKYSWIIFDADGTLFDYVRAEAEALRRAMQSAGLSYGEDVLQRYQRINAELWKAYEAGQITQEALRTERFSLLFEALGVRDAPADFSDRYLKELSICGYLLEGAQAVIAALAGEVSLLLMTNGIGPVQRSRLAHSPLKDQFEHLVISSEIGAAKPAPRIFQVALERMGQPEPGEVLMVGDNYNADILGAQPFGFDTCWMNPNGVDVPAGERPTFTVASLGELLDILYA